MLKKIRTRDLEVGMFVADFNTPWINHPFLPNRKLIRNPSEIQALLDHGVVEVLVDPSRSRGTPRGESPRPRPPLRSPGPTPPAAPGATPFEEDRRRAAEAREEARAAVESLFEDARAGRGVDDRRARAAVEGLLEALFRNRDALLSLARVREFDDYTFQHSVNVAVFALALGSSLGILGEELVRLGTGSLLHDLGKVRLPRELVQKAGALSDEEFERFKTHAALGAGLLLDARSIPDECAAVVLNHHERYDGSGYPRGLREGQIGKFGLIGAIADVYDAMTTDRAYQRRVLPCEALRRVYGWAGTRFHPLYARRFIQCLGLYPPGSLVRLSTGELAVVLRPNRDRPLLPRVRVATSAGGSLLPDPFDADLRLSPDRSVVEVLDPEGGRLDVEAVLSGRGVR